MDTTEWEIRQEKPTLDGDNDQKNEKQNFGTRFGYFGAPRLRRVRTPPARHSARGEGHLSGPGAAATGRQKRRTWFPEASKNTSEKTA